MCGRRRKRTKPQHMVVAEMLKPIENTGLQTTAEDCERQFSASALHLIRVCSVSERDTRKALKQLLFRFLHLKTHL